MKLLFPLCLTLFLSGSLFSQEIDGRLLKRYTSSELAEMKASNPANYSMLIYALDNALYLADMPEGKDFSADVIEVDIENLPSYIELGLEIKKENQYFMVAGQNKLLIMKSEWVLNHEMNK